MTYKRSKPLNPDLSSKVIDALGGTASVAGFCSVTSAAVSYWRKYGIPPAQIRFLREKFKRNPVMKNDEIRSF